MILNRTMTSTIRRDHRPNAIHGNGRSANWSLQSTFYLYLCSTCAYTGPQRPVSLSPGTFSTIARPKSRWSLNMPPFPPTNVYSVLSSQMKWCRIKRFVCPEYVQVFKLEKQHKSFKHSAQLSLFSFSLPPFSLPMSVHVEKLTF
jgi:hypothetical protein